jgi:hypothetical protein
VRRSTSVRERGNIWWYDFTFAGRRIQESTKSTSKTIAKDGGTETEARVGTGDQQYPRGSSRVLSRTGVNGRLHDAHHTLISELAESGAGDETIMDIAGHASRQMVRHYSHIRMQAKREALGRGFAGSRSKPRQSKRNRIKHSRAHQSHRFPTLWKESPYKFPYRGCKKRSKGVSVCF